MTNPQFTDSKLWTNKNFPNKIKEGEDIVLITREDLVIPFTRALSYVLIFVLLLLLKTIATGYLNNIMIDMIDSVFYLTNIILLTSFTLFFHNYYLSLQIVTSERIIDIDQQGIFLREVNELPIDNIEDVTYKQNGFWGTVFNYGNVIVQTAGSAPTNYSETEHKDNENSTSGFVFNNVPYPSEISNTITKLRQKNKEDQMKDHALLNAQALKNQFK